MFAQVFRVIVGIVVTYLVRAALRMLTAPVRREETSRPSSRPSPRPTRIHIDRENIVEGKFEDIPD